MKYSVDIDRNIEALAICFQRIRSGINDIWDWNVRVNAGGIDYGIYFNFDIDRKELEISNQQRYDNTLYLDDIIDLINDDEDADEDETEN